MNPPVVTFRAVLWARLRLVSADTADAASSVVSPGHPETPIPDLSRLRDLSDLVTPADGCITMIGGGGYGEIWMGLLETGSIRGPTKVAVKHLLSPSDISPADERRIRARLRREIAVWQRLRHENVLPLLGIVNKQSRVGMVSPWIEAGNLNQYIQRANITDTQRLQLPCDVACGLSYLHSNGVIHGDLNSANVLIDKKGAACIADFGLSFIKVEMEGSSYMTSTFGGAMRWRAPELVPRWDARLDETFAPTLTPKCDIYSLANVALQALSGQLPHFDITVESLVLVALSQRIPPNRPPSEILTDAYWEYLQLFLRSQPKSRPSAKDAHTVFCAFCAAVSGRSTPAQRSLSRAALFSPTFLDSWRRLRGGFRRALHSPLQGSPATD